MKFKEIQAKHIIKIHHVLVNIYNISNGYVDKGKIESLLEKIEFLNNDDVLQRSAILLEGLIRLHAFTDGNKRTALESVKTYLNINNYYLIFPLSTVAFTYKIASTQEIDPKNNEKLINEIYVWLKRFSVFKKNNIKIYGLVATYYLIPFVFVQFCLKIKLTKLGNFVLKLYLQKNVKDLNNDMMIFILKLLKEQIETFDKKNIK